MVGARTWAILVVDDGSRGAFPHVPVGDVLAGVLVCAISGNHVGKCGIPVPRMNDRPSRQMVLGLKKRIRDFSIGVSLAHRYDRRS